MGAKEIKEEDLDFYLTIIMMFCNYNETLHYSDRMFADITSDIIKRDRIIERLANDGYITARQSNNIPHRFEIGITTKGIDFQTNGGFKKQNNDKIKQKIELTSSKLLICVFSAIVGGIITKIIDLLL